MADCRNDSSAAAVHPSRHDSNASGVRFDGGAQYLGKVLDDQNLAVIELEVYEL